MDKNKRGIEILHENLFTILILLFVFVSLLYFINQQATGKLIEKQVLAKEICLVSLASKPGIFIEIEHNPELIITQESNGILVSDRQGAIAKGYFYDCYGNFEISPVSEGKTQVVTR